MVSIPQPLINTIKILTQYGANVCRSGHTITVHFDITKPKTEFSRIRPILHALLNKYGTLYFVIIRGIPSCMLPEASRFIQYTKDLGTRYRQEKICQTCKFQNHCPGWPENHKVSPLPPAIDDLPSEVTFEITKKCNLKCPPCFSTLSNKEMPLERIKAAIDECVQVGVKAVRFSGGEPLFHKDVSKALYYAKSKNLYVILNTNATSLNKEKEEAIRDCVDNSLTSLQGFTPESEKLLTKSPFDFRKKLSNLIKLNSMIPWFRLGSIISRTLVDNFDKYFYLVRQLGVEHWELYRPKYPDGPEEFNIKKEDLLWIMERMKSIRSQGFDIKLANPLPFCIANDLSFSRYVLFGAAADDGHSRIVYDVDGFYKTSYYIPDNLGRSIREAWQNPFLVKMRSLEYLPPKCQSCQCLQWCKGGSRFLARSANGDYFSSDPLMSYNEQAVMV